MELWQTGLQYLSKFFNHFQSCKSVNDLLKAAISRNNGKRKIISELSFNRRSSGAGGQNVNSVLESSIDF
jgi:protein subunit release factor B